MRSTRREARPANRVGWQFARTGLRHRHLLTFGLRSPGTGVKVMIDATPEVLRTCAAVVYVALGATPVNLARDQGEADQNSLLARVCALGIENHGVSRD